MVAEGSTRTQCVRFIGFITSEQCAAYTPDCVTIERLDGFVLASRRRPGEHFPGENNHEAWDDLDLAFYCGRSVWSCMTMPFVLLHPGVEVEELPIWLERGQVRRRLRRGIRGVEIEVVAHERAAAWSKVMELDRYDLHR